MKHGLKPVADMSNRLVAVWYDPETRRYSKQAKRVSKNCPMTQAEVTAYVQDVVTGVKMIRDRLNCTLGEALKVLRHAKSGRW